MFSLLFNDYTQDSENTGWYGHATELNMGPYFICGIGGQCLELIGLFGFIASVSAPVNFELF